MAAERCPLCQSKLKNGECLSCGYRLPDEGDISALYNYDPSDYPQEQPAVREIIPDVQMEEIYPGRPEMPDIKVHDEQNNTVGRYGTGANRESGQGQQNKQINIPPDVAHLFDANGNFIAGNKHPQQNNSPNPYADNGSFTPYQSPPQQKSNNPYANNGNFSPYQTPPQQNNNPYANNGNFQPYQKHTGFNYSSTQSDINSYGDFFRKYWWALLLSVLVPFLGIIFFITFKNKVDRRYAMLFIVAFFIGRIFFL
ncbi:MAG: hypothetical protein J1F11_11215 [Oscillospiraceae bacterium]|nr:hypothetical protein [Oscillospiraceae bacterium]